MNIKLSSIKDNIASMRYYDGNFYNDFKTGKQTDQRKWKVGFTEPYLVNGEPQYEAFLSCNAARKLDEAKAAKKANKRNAKSLAETFYQTASLTTYMQDTDDGETIELLCINIDTSIDDGVL
jgi:hypothetical protein